MDKPVKGYVYVICKQHIDVFLQFCIKNQSEWLSANYEQTGLILFNHKSNPKH